MTYAVEELPVEDFERPSGFKEPVRVSEPNDDKKAEEDKKKKEAEEKKKKAADEKKEAQDAKPSESGWAPVSSRESSAPRSSIAPARQTAKTMKSEKLQDLTCSFFYRTWKRLPLLTVNESFINKKRIPSNKRLI